MWWTITGNFGNILPIDWSKTFAQPNQPISSRQRVSYSNRPHTTVAIVCAVYEICIVMILVWHKLIKDAGY